MFTSALGSFDRGSNQRRADESAYLQHWMLNFSKHVDIRTLKAMIINNRVFPYHLHELEVFRQQDRYKKLH